MRVSVRHATKVIKGTTVLNDVSLDIPSGRVTGLRGINGSGKTMLMRVVCGLVKLNSGSVEVDGNVLGRDIDAPPSVGLLIEHPGFLDGFTGFDNLWLLARLTGRAARRDVMSAIETVGLDPQLKKPYRTYSLGMKQRLGIAAAIMERPDLIVLDEPTNALDEQGVAMVRNVVAAERDRGAAVLIASHDADALSYLADTIYVMHRGVLKREVANESS